MTTETPLFPADTARLQALEWLTPARVRQFEKFGLSTIGELLTHFPRRHEDRLRFDSFPREPGDRAVCVYGVVTKVGVRFLGGRRRMVEVFLQEEEAHALSSSLTCRWFNVHHVQKMVAVGHRIVVYGKPKRSGKQIVIDHPDFEVMEEGDLHDSPHFNRITPVHPATEGLSPRLLRSTIHRVLQEAEGRYAFRQALPGELAGRSPLEVLKAIHFPASVEELEAARKEWVLGEFFDMQLCLAARRADRLEESGAGHCGPGELLERFHTTLPFPLTGAQQRAIDEIRGDLKSSRPMNRMLHGDVGSGKTLVALSAILLSVEAGFQAALMAPTQILAEQHYLNFRRWLEPLGINVALRTGARREESGAMPLFALDTSHGSDGAGGEPQVIVGTHALLYDEPLPRLGLAVIDEQHKFGAQQRAALLKGAATPPDVLVMTATPIPRTLTMTLYGDLDVSILDELPAGRGEIVTAARDESKRPDAIAFMQRQLEKGRQIYIVYPLIEESAKLEAKAAAAEFEQWREVFSGYRCELLHGRLGPEEKEAIMQRFRANESQVLVATTVIEVGIDVPNANLMLIENAERFGLAQLHQLRGRIGRGRHKSFCILLHRAETEEGLFKMSTMERTSDGFEIAEADLQLRGPGDILGTAQSGGTPFKLGNPLTDGALMVQARKAAMALFKSDPGLETPGNARFKAWLAERRRLNQLAFSQT